MENAKLFVIVRADLPVGAQLAQSNHAAIKMALSHTRLVAEWNEASNNIALLSVPNESALIEIYSRALERPDTAASAFYEPDFDGSMTAVALLGGSARKLTSLLPCAGAARITQAA